MEATVPEQLDDLGVALDELGRGLPVVGGPLGKAQLPVQEVEQRAVPQLEPSPLAVEDREGDEELGERVVLAAEEVGEAGGLFAGGRHSRRVACVLEASWNARIPVLARDPERPSRTPHATPRRPRRARGRVVEGASRASLRSGASTHREPVKLPLGSQSPTVNGVASRQRTALGLGATPRTDGWADLAGTFPSRGAAPPATALDAPNPASSSETPPRPRRTASPREQPSADRSPDGKPGRQLGSRPRAAADD